MKCFTSISAILVILVLTVCGEDAVTSNILPTRATTTAPPTTTTTPSTTTVTTATPSTTTAGPSTTTTASPTTPTSAPSSSTTEPPTPTSAPSTTTTAPSTSTEHPITTQAPPSEGSWSVNGSEGICIKIDLKADFQIYFNTTTGKVNFTEVSVPVRSSDVTVVGNCNGYNTSRNESIALEWKDSEGTTFTLNLLFNGTTDGFKVSNISLHYYLNNNTFPDVTSEGERTAHMMASQDYLGAHYNHSLRCSDNKHVQLSGADIPADGVVLHVADIRLQAFMKSHENVFGEEENCVASSSSQIVPIAVGCALLALVLIVVAAYLISRRRSRQGYQSV